MKPFVVVALAIALIASASLPTDAFARRFGGGGAAGMQRSLPPRAAPSVAPSVPPTSPAAAAAQRPAAALPAAAAAPKRSWLGPIAGLAAGLGIAALMSHLGFGAEFGNIVMLALLALVAVVVIRFVVRRFAPAGVRPAMQVAGAGAPWRASDIARPATADAADAATISPPLVQSLPAGFDVPGFERIAKLIFIRMQAANDAGDLNDLRNFTTPEMFAAARLELQDRSGRSQRTDVVRVDAEVLDVASEAERQVVSVRFHGLIVEQAQAAAVAFDEVWHLVKPADGSREWAIAGIQPAAPLAEAA